MISCGHSCTAGIIQSSSESARLELKVYRRSLDVRIEDEHLKPRVRSEPNAQASTDIGQILHQVKCDVSIKRANGVDDAVMEVETRLWLKKTLHRSLPRPILLVEYPGDFVGRRFSYSTQPAC